VEPARAGELDLAPAGADEALLLAEHPAAALITAHEQAASPYRAQAMRSAMCR